MVEFTIENIYTVGNTRRASALFVDFGGYEISVEIEYSDIKEIQYMRCLECMVSDVYIEGSQTFAKFLSKEIISFGYAMANKNNDRNAWMSWADKKSSEVLSLVDFLSVDDIKKIVLPFISQNKYKKAVLIAENEGYILHVISKIRVYINDDRTSIIKLFEKNSNRNLSFTNKELNLENYNTNEYQSDYKLYIIDKVEFFIFDGYFDYDDNIFVHANSFDDNVKDDITITTNVEDGDGNYEDIKWEFPSESSVRNRLSGKVKVFINRLLK